jgi:FtsH-binding integral membrane protein
MLIGVSVTLSICQVLLVRADGRSAVIFVALLTIGCLLRARLYPIVKQRMLLLVPGTVGAAGLAIGPITSGRADATTLVVPVMLLVGVLVTFVGLRYSTRPPNPYLGRSAELLEVVVILALVPVACSVLGLYGIVRGLGG